MFVIVGRHVISVQLAVAPKHYVRTAHTVTTPAAGPLFFKYSAKTHQQNIISMKNAEYSSVPFESKEFYLKLHEKLCENSM
jgi:hypothetical protein